MGRIRSPSGEEFILCLEDIYWEKEIFPLRRSKFHRTQHFSLSRSLFPFDFSQTLLLV